jgi:hypothetical protein
MPPAEWREPVEEMRPWTDDIVQPMSKPPVQR